MGLHAVLQQLPAAVLLPHHRWMKSVELPKGTEMVMPGDNVKMVVTLITPSRWSRVGFIREGGKTVGAGVVAKILE